jgi:RimJ/RimL family protein N-acetyltransferase
MYYGEKVRLRAMELTDLPEIMKHWNTYETRKFLLIQVPMSENAERKWLETVSVVNPWRDGHMVLAIEDKRTHQFLGSVSLENINAQHRRAEFGIAIHDPRNLSKGYGTDAAKVILWVGFHVLGLQSIFLVTMASNVRAQRAYEKAGFKRAGLFRKSLFSQGRFEDLVLMDVVSEEFALQHPGSRQIGSPS